MQIRVLIERENKSKDINIDKSVDIKKLLESLKINPVTVIVAVNDEIVLEDYRLKNKDNVEILSVVSGG
jgi:thiamine biosynthesis protein ThiS